MSLPPTAQLLAFDAVARRSSFALAATELHLTPSAVSHQVAKLEAQLGIRLFERNAHGVWLSSAGESYLARISGAVAAIVTATEDLKHGVGNSLYVHSAPSIASLWLMPRLRGFAKAHPHIALNLSAAHTPSDFELGQADVDIRYGVPQWPANLEVEPLFEELIVPLASPEFIREHRLKTIEQLLDVPLIQSNVSLIQWADWFRKFSAAKAPERFAVRFDRAQMSLDAATQGLGVALESVVNAGGHLADRKLVAPFGMSKAVKVKAHFVVYPSRNAGRAPLQAFLTWVHQEAAKTRQR
ncbi:LysR substrate-binding domain-containing protein [Xenophilus arseniciresistens]|uniref:LysR substrate-binding domain-containing protein n=1 Tax=Xenophilus arseniciresistens TaxID=1283306 RepID=A0AAE3SYD4_9BURK|nr:LysR substrate-binding domain-containing protein [Xenophilus arseniciresistens]MDA7415982.1 LysR substrate-binding domain-containing protein [Xenophilus arseniciresistens]